MGSDIAFHSTKPGFAANNCSRWAVRMVSGMLTIAVLLLSPVAWSNEEQLVHDYEFIDTFIDYRIYDLPPSMAFMKRFGNWQRGDQEGLVRLVVADAGEPMAQRHHLIYLQWVCRCEDGTVSMIPVSELNREGPFIYTQPEIRRRGQTWYAELVARNTRTEDTSVVRLFVPRVGEYRVEYDVWDGDR